MLQIDPTAVSFLLGLLVALAGVIGWFMRLERRLAERMTRAEHEKICGQKHVQITTAISSLQTSIERKEEYSSQQRHQLREIVQSVEIKVTAAATQLQNLKEQTVAIDRKVEQLRPRAKT